jgi:hypothetical protein
VNVTVEAPLVDVDRKSDPAIVIFTEAFPQLLPQAGAVFGVTDVTTGTGLGVP